MGKLSIVEKMIHAAQHNEQMPLKGHAKIILADPITGKPKEIIESDNMVTNAVASILAKNYCGLARFSTILPLKSLFAGVMCFQNEITEDEDNFNPPNDIVNPMIAHAGDEAHSTASTYRGNPNAGEQVVTDTSIKQVWDWSTNQGNGTISCVCLVPNTLGNMGLKPFDSTYSPLANIGGDENYNHAWSESISKEYPFRLSDDGQTMFSVFLDGTTFKERTMRHDYFTFGIMRSSRTWQDVAVRSATVRSGSNRIIVDDDDYYYIIRASSATSLAIDKVDKTDMSVGQADITYSGASLFTGTISGLNSSMRIFAFDGTYLYFPNSDGTGFYKLNLSDNSDITALEGTITIDKGRLATAVNGDQFANPLVISDGLVLGCNYIINGNNVYQIKHQNGVGCSVGYLGYNNYSMLLRDGASCYYNNKHTYEDNSKFAGQGNALVKMFLSTINNLETSVTKSTSQTMKIEYTITEET